jgi:hypothetical protein
VRSSSTHGGGARSAARHRERASRPTAPRRKMVGSSPSRHVPPRPRSPWAESRPPSSACRGGRHRRLPLLLSHGGATTRGRCGRRARAAAPSASSLAWGRGSSSGGRAGAAGPSASSPVRWRSGRTHSPRCVAPVLLVKVRRRCGRGKRNERNERRGASA